jgi:hypothetical protein
VMALLRDDAGRPADIPAHITIKRPNGQVFLETTPTRTADASVHLPVALSPGAPAGTWTVEVKADPGLPPILAPRISASMPSCPIGWPSMSVPPPGRWFPAGPMHCR